MSDRRDHDDHGTGPGQPARPARSGATTASYGSTAASAARRVRQVERARPGRAPATARPARRTGWCRPPSRPTTTEHRERWAAAPRGAIAGQSRRPAAAAARTGWPARSTGHGHGHRERQRARATTPNRTSSGTSVARRDRRPDAAFDARSAASISTVSAALGADASRATSRSTRSRLPAPAQATTGTPCSRSWPIMLSRSSRHSRWASVRPRAALRRRPPARAACRPRPRSARTGRAGPASRPTAGRPAG